MTIVPIGVSPADGRPERRWPPPVLEDFLAELHHEDSPLGPGGRRYQECQEVVDDGKEDVEALLIADLACLVHIGCVA